MKRVGTLDNRSDFLTKALPAQKACEHLQGLDFSMFLWMPRVRGHALLPEYKLGCSMDLRFDDCSRAGAARVDFAGSILHNREEAKSQPPGSEEG